MHIAILEATYTANGADATYIGDSGVEQAVRAVYSEAAQLAFGAGEVAVRDSDIVFRIRKSDLAETPQRGDVIFYEGHRYTVDGKQENRMEWFINARI